MNKKCCIKSIEVPLTELSQQLEYARTISSDIYEVFSQRTPRITEMLNEYQAVRTKLSMLQDFLFQAKLWCDTVLPENDEEIYKEEK